MMKKRHVLYLAMGVVMTPLLGSCAADEIVGGAGSGNGVLSFGVEVNAGATEVKPMGGATRSAEINDSSAVMSPDVEGFFPTSSIELSSVDGNAIYANCDERRGINMHNNVDYKITRGSIQTTENFYKSFALYGYVYDGGQTWSSVGKSTSVDTNIEGIEMIKGNSNDYNASGAYWPGGSKKATFFAVAPKDCSGKISADQGGPKIIYTVPQDVSSQEDLLIAKSEEDITCDGKNAPSLKFYHALAAIKFVKGENLGGFTRISNVEISGVYNKGTLSSFTPSDTNNNLEWTDQSIDGSGTNTYTSDLSNVLFLMPQTFPDEAEIKVTFSDGSNSQNFTAKLKDDTHTTWEAGHQYTYKLSVNKVTGTFIFEVTSPTNPVPVDGGDATFNVKSYFQYQDNSKKVPIPWSCSYTIDETPYMLIGDGSVEGEDKSITIGKNTNTITHTEVLQNNPMKGSEASPYDLSTNGGKSSMNTANCYVVNSKGIYSIPLVYGCAIKDGQPNENSYNKTTFVNHEGNQINSPYIYRMVKNIDGAKLIWQDVQNMVTNIKLSSDKQSLIFTIGDNDNIAQGNAVVAATAGETVVWSWHIWVTNRDVSVTAAVPTKAFDTSYTYNFMPVPLGWCDITITTVGPRNFTLSLTQGQSGKNLSASISQAGNPATSGNFTYYQWGRKDPFVGSTGTEKTCKTWYDENGASKSSLLIDNTTRSKVYGIKNPGYFIYGDTQWDTDATTYDNWNAKLNSDTPPSTTYNYDAVEKTVYDPSPVGYKLPPTNAFTGFVKQDDYWGDETTKANGSTFNEGWNFYTGGQNTGPTDFWIAGGYRHYGNTGSLFDVGTTGSYWSADSFSGYYPEKYGRYMKFKSTLVYPREYFFRAAGCSVRPVLE